jgi:hypothetical protein
MHIIASEVDVVYRATYSSLIATAALASFLRTGLGSFVARIDKPTATRILDIVDALAAVSVGVRRQ